MTDFLFNLAMGVMLTVSTITLFFGGVLVLEWIIHTKPLKRVGKALGGVVKIIRVWRAL